MTELTPAKMKSEFKRALKQAGSQGKLAKQVGVAQALISMTARGARPVGPSLAAGLGYEVIKTARGRRYKPITHKASERRRIA